MREFVGYRVKHRGIATSTIRSDVAVATKFLSFIRVHGRSPASMCVAEIDGFVLDLTSKSAKTTVAGNCSTLRAFLRFLHLTRRVRVAADLERFLRSSAARMPSTDATQLRLPGRRTRAVTRV